MVALLKTVSVFLKLNLHKQGYFLHLLFLSMKAHFNFLVINTANNFSFIPTGEIGDYYL